MGNLLIYSESFTNIEKEKVNEQIADFIDSFNTAIYYKDKVYQKYISNT